MLFRISLIFTSIQSGEESECQSLLAADKKMVATDWHRCYKLYALCNIL